jgi:hypothetical protein
MEKAFQFLDEEELPDNFEWTGWKRDDGLSGLLY